MTLSILLIIGQYKNLDTTLSCVNWVLDSNLAAGYAANRFVEVILQMLL